MRVQSSEFRVQKKLEARHCQAFTLIELSIVLVIIGLIVGGVLVGRDLMQAAQWKKMQRDLVEYETAAMAFKLKYNQLPGDINNASQFWGTYCQQSSFSNTTCNGNNNGILDAFYVAPHLGWIGSSSVSTEANMFWRHLYLAGLVKNDLSGWTGGGGLRGGVYPGITVPKSEFSSGVYAARKGFIVGNFRASAYPSAAGSWGSLTYDTSQWTNVDVKQFDTKFDDGLPNTGKIKGSGLYNPGPHVCFQGNSYSNNEYNLVNYQNHCTIVYEWLK